MRNLVTSCIVLLVAAPLGQTACAQERVNLYKGEPANLAATMATTMRGKSVATEVGESKKFIIGGQYIADKKEMESVRALLGEALVGSGKARVGWHVNPASLQDPAVGIASDIQQALESNYGTIGLDASQTHMAPTLDAAGFIVSVQPKGWQLYRPSLYVDPVFTYMAEISILSLPDRTSLVQGRCAFWNRNTVTKRPYVLTYFGENAAILRSDLAKVRSACVSSFLRESLGI